MLATLELWLVNLKRQNQQTACAGGTMIDSYGATRRATRPRRPCAGGTMIDSYGATRRRRSSPPALCRWNDD